MLTVDCANCDRHYKEGRYERPPYTPDTLRSVYHVRELEVFKLAQVRAFLLFYQYS